MATHEELTIKLGMMQALFNEAMDRADKAEARVMGLELALKSLHVAVDEMISTPEEPPMKPFTLDDLLKLHPHEVVELLNRYQEIDTREATPTERDNIDLRIRVAELEAQKEAAYQDGRRHACALLSLLVYDSDGEPLNTGSLLGICNDVEESMQPKG